MKLAILIGIILPALIVFNGCSKKEIKNTNFNQASREYHTKKSINSKATIMDIAINPFSNKKFIESVGKSSIDRGRRLYKDRCWQCHGEKGVGDGPVAEYLENRPQNLVKILAKVPDAFMFLNVSKWNGEMPGWERSLTQNEINDLAAYLTHLTGKK